jgi:hypothetical protein
MYWQNVFIKMQKNTYQFKWTCIQLMIDAHFLGHDMKLWNKHKQGDAFFRGYFFESTKKNYGIWGCLCYLYM